MRKFFHEPADVAEKEWAELECIFVDSMYLCVVQSMRKVNNEPQKACDILPEGVVNQGHEQVNIILRNKKQPFRFTRTESWANELRSQRKLAFIRWPVVYRLGEQMVLPFLGKTRYGNRP